MNNIFDKIVSLCYDSAMESKASDRAKLKDSDFAIPEKRKYPINDKDSVLNGIKYFKFVPKEDQKECADNLYKAAKKFGINITVTKGNPFVKYHSDVKVVAPIKKKSDSTKK